MKRRSGSTPARYRRKPTNTPKPASTLLVKLRRSYLTLGGAAIADSKDLDLGETDYDEITNFPPPERRIVTQPYDLSVTTLVEQWNDGSWFR